MRRGAALVLAAAVLAAGCKGGREREVGPASGQPAAEQQPAGSAAPADAASAYQDAQARLDRGDVPGAVEPLRKAYDDYAKSTGVPRDEIGFLLTQARAASDPATVDARIADMRDDRFQAFVDRGELSRVPFFDDARIDAYFRKQLLAKRDDARDIRARVRGK